MIKIENGHCKIQGSLEELTDDFEIFLQAIKLSESSKLLQSFIDVLEKEIEECKEQF